MVRALTSAGCVAAEDEADELLAAAGGDSGTLDALLARRTSGEPLAWVTGTARFCDIEVTVRPGVYVPRWQSEVLARHAANWLPPDGVAVDLCTGSGAIAMVLMAARPGATVVAADIDPAAVACARANGVDARIGDLDSALPTELSDRVDVMTGVLPYVPAGALHLLPRDVQAFEPRLALDGGTDGLGVVARAVVASTRWVVPGGWLLLEVGGGQFEPVSRLFAQAGYESVEVLTDGDDDPRAVCGRRSGTPAPDRPVQASSR